MAKRIITTDILEEDVSSEKNLRPQTLEQMCPPLAKSQKCAIIGFIRNYEL